MSDGLRRRIDLQTKRLQLASRPVVSFHKGAAAVLAEVSDRVAVQPANSSERDSTIITSTMALAELAENGPDVDLLHQRVQCMPSA